MGLCYCVHVSCWAKYCGISAKLIPSSVITLIDCCHLFLDHIVVQTSLRGLIVFLSTGLCCSDKAATNCWQDCDVGDFPHSWFHCSLKVLNGDFDKSCMVSEISPGILRYLWKWHTCGLKVYLVASGGFDHTTLSLSSVFWGTPFVTYSYIQCVLWNAGRTHYDNDNKLGL